MTEYTSKITFEHVKANEIHAWLIGERINDDPSIVIKIDHIGDKFINSFGFNDAVDGDSLAVIMEYAEKAREEYIKYMDCIPNIKLSMEADIASY